MKKCLSVLWATLLLLTCIPVSVSAVCGIEGHRVTEPTCTEDGVCRDCGIVYAALGHRYNEAGICGNCGEKQEIIDTPTDPVVPDVPTAPSEPVEPDIPDVPVEPEECPHEYDLNCDNFCNYCGHERQGYDHVYDDSRDAVCNVCGVAREGTTTGSDVIYMQPWDIMTETPGIYITLYIEASGDYDHIWYLCPPNGNAIEMATGWRMDMVLTEDLNNSTAYCLLTHRVTGATVRSRTVTLHIHVFNNGCDATCNQCRYQRETPGHDYDAICDPDCFRCGYVRPVEHSYGPCSTECYYCGIAVIPTHQFSAPCDETCDGCGADRQAAAAHTYEHPCSEYCSLCWTRWDASGLHTYDNACDGQCNVCYAERDVEPHWYDNDCDPDCNACGEERPVYDHWYYDDCDPDCNECGALREVPGHQYDDDTDPYCNLCGAWRSTDPNQPDVSWCDHRNSIGATCVGAGLCADCGTVFPARGHQYDDESDQECNDCYAWRDLACDHEAGEPWCYGGNVNGLHVVVYDCIHCYQTLRTEAERCYGGTATCWDSAQCERCYLNYGDADGDHAYDDEYDAYCNLCGQMREGFCYHPLMDQPTCTEEGYCPDCGATIAPLGHRYDEICSDFCGRCGAERDTAGLHVYDDEDDWTCNVCIMSRKTYTDATGAFAYTVVNGKAVVKGYYGSDAVLTVPDSLSGYPVVSIGSDAFYACATITRVILPEGLTSIGEAAFALCSALTEITIPDGVTIVNVGAFSGCTALTAITLPESVTTIGYGAFDGCTALDTITVPDGVTSIGEFAFFDTAYYNDPANWDGGLYVGRHLIYIADNNARRYDIREGTLTIADGAATGYFTYLLEVTIPEGVVIIGKDAFYGFPMTSVVIPSTVTTIGECAFAATDLTAVVVPDSVTSIGDAVFSNCWDLTSAVIGSGVTSINGGMFFWCESLTSITFGANITYIGEGAFYNCESLSDVYFTGTEEQAAAILIEDTDNSCLRDATWHYNACIGSATHTYQAATCTDPKTCIFCGVTEGEALDHVYTSVRTAPTCTAGGYTTYTCATCGDSYVADQVAALGHAWAAATCTEAKTCAACGATEGEALGHSYSPRKGTDPTCSTAGEVEYMCDGCGDAYTEAIPATGEHTYDSGTVTKKATCKATGVKTYTCTVCGETKTEAVAKLKTHTYDNACDKACNVCGATRTIKHSYKAATCTKAKTCKVCGVTSGKALGHKYTNSCDTTCNTCKATRKITHSYKTVTKKATTSANGYTVKRCSVCKKETGKTTIYKASKISLSKTAYTYNGKAVKPTVTVKDSKGNKIASSNYTITYASGRKNVGTYKVTIKFKGKYSGTKTLTFKINPVKTTVSKLTAAKKSLKVTITKKTPQVTGYEVQYATNKNFTSAKTKTLTSYKKNTLSLTGLKAKTTYYVRVRTYKTVNGKKYYSGWSTVKSLKTK